MSAWLPSSGGGTIRPSRPWSPVTSRGCSRSAGTCCPRARTPRTSSRRSSPPPLTPCWPTTGPSTCGRGCTASRATAASTTCAAPPPWGWTRWTSTSPTPASRPARRCSSARPSGCSWTTFGRCPSPSERPCCCARWRPSPTRRSPRPWRPRCPASSRCWCGPGCRWPRPPRPAGFPVTRSDSSWARLPSLVPAQPLEYMKAG